jgi:MinD-like ATPase involved in chromosome partitioning or flagellar assembly
VTDERFVLLGLAPARSDWFASLSQWTTSASVAAEFIKCVSPEEVRARLASGRRHSALIVDSRSPHLDRDLLQRAADASTPVVVVRDSRSPSLGLGSGVAAELLAGFGPDELMDVLATNCRMVGRGDRLPAALNETASPLWLAQMFTVCGPGGTGVSTLAIALSQGLAADARFAGRVLLADLARRADQAMLHDAQDAGPGVQELVEAHRLERPEPEAVRQTTFSVPTRGYSLLLGLRQPEAWTALRPRSIDASIESLRRSYQVVVADVTGDLEGEADGGSADVEERNHLARRSVLTSTAVIAVGTAGMKGVHSLAQTIRSLVRIGVSEERIVTVFNRAPRNPKSRAESGRALSVLLEGSAPNAAGPVHVPERKIEDALRDGTPLSSALVNPITRSVLAVAERLADSAPQAVVPMRVEPGSMGAWTGADFEAGSA